MGELWFITGFCDRTNELQTKWLEFGVRASFLFNPPAKSQTSDDKRVRKDRECDEPGSDGEIMNQLNKFHICVSTLDRRDQAWTRAIFYEFLLV
jgi:hypothetical protein